MSKFPTPTNPLVLFYSGIMPSMKNGIAVRLKKDRTFVGIGRKPAITKRLAELSSSAKLQWKRQGFDYIETPTQVGVFCKLGVYMAKDNKDLLPKADADNAYTSIQETLMDIVMPDDRQIASFQVARKPFRIKEIPEFTLTFLWVLDTEKLEEEWYLEDMQILFVNEYLKKHTPIEMIRHATTERQ